MSNEIFELYGDDPMALCRSWYNDAKETEPNDPDAICISTCSDNRPSARMILIKEIDDKGFKFHTNSNSRKGQDLAANPRAAFCWYWKTQRKQIRVEGAVEKVSEAEADEYFSSRPTERQIGAWASNQSQPFDRREELEAAVKKYETEFADTDQIPRPPYWEGYWIKPERMEFWLAHKARVHTRFVYTRDDDSWNATWLCP